MPGKHNDEGEGFARIWQVNNLLEGQERLEKSLQAMNTAMNSQAAAHNTQIETFRASTVSQKDLQTAMELVDLKYGPVKRNLGKLSWLIIGLLIGVIAQLVMNFVGK